MADSNAKEVTTVGSGVGVVEGKLVQFLRDVAPYCKDDIVRLDAEAVKYVEARVKALNLDGKVYSTSVKPVENHVEGGQNPVVGAVQAVPAAVVDNPTTVHGGTVLNEQDAPKDLKPTDAEVKARTTDEKNPRGGSTPAATAGTTTVGA